MYAKQTVGVRVSAMLSRRWDVGLQFEVMRLFPRFTTALVVAQNTGSKDTQPIESARKNNIKGS